MATLRPMPILLSDQVEMVSTGSFTPISATLDAQRMGAPFGRAMLLREIRFQIQQARTGTNLTLQQAAGFVLNVNMRMGRAVITNGYVPVWCLGTAMCANAEVPGTAQGAQSYFAPVAPYGGRISAYRWIFPKPLFVPAGCPITVELMLALLFGQGANTDFIVGVSMAGLLLPPGTRTPDKVWVPYATAFNGPTTNNAAPNTIVQTGQNDLANRTNKDLEVQRLIGRYVYISRSGTGRFAFENLGVDNAASVADPNVFNEAPMIQIQSTTGYMLVPRMTPWNAVFGPHRDLPLRYTMGASEGLTCKIATASVTITDSTQAQIGLIGQRQELAGEI